MARTTAAPDTCRVGVDSHGAAVAKRGWNPFARRSGKERPREALPSHIVARIAVHGAGPVRSIDLDWSRVTVGRQSDNVIALPDDLLASRHHATLELRDGHWWIRDLRSRNGTLVDGRSIDGMHPLVEGSTIKIGRTELVIHDVADDAGLTAADNLVGPRDADRLSAREREVMTLVAQGLSDERIAEALFISTSTVRSHLDRIRHKTGHRRRAELIRYAHDAGLA
jgi:DNA-binding CsgD family transcriptional regulator